MLFNFPLLNFWYSKIAYFCLNFFYSLVLLLHLFLFFYNTNDNRNEQMDCMTSPPYYNYCTVLIINNNNVPSDSRYSVYDQVALKKVLTRYLFRTSFTMKLCCLLIFIVILFQLSQCAKILGVFPIADKSHYILGSSLMKGLAEKGHDVTVITFFGESNPPKNGSYRNIVLDFELKRCEYILSIKFKIMFIMWQLSTRSSGARRIL